VSSLHKKNKHLSIILSAIVFSMLILAFASVPLYRIFCQKTGYGGTPKIALDESKAITNHRLTIRFNADVHRDLPWRFKPLQQSVEVYAGENALAFYHFENVSNQPLVGIASYNVTPDKAAPYFNKIQCFCFEDQILGPKQGVDMPVMFYIDPKIVDDPDLKDVRTITLSYTFFSSKHPNINKILGLPPVSKNRE
jgi:cytochrome c oxidase assembly protein subunit 11